MSIAPDSPQSSSSAGSSTGSTGEPRSKAASPVSRATGSEPLASVMPVATPNRCFGFESADFEVEVRNLRFEPLADPRSVGHLQAVANLHRADGSFVRNLLTAQLPEPIPIGHHRRIPFGMNIPTFAGDYEVRYGIQALAEGNVPRPVPIATEPAKILVKNTIFEAFVELINACNFRCTFCPQTILQRKQRPMDFDLATKIVKDLTDMEHHHPIRVHLLGEPLLYPRFFDFVDMAHDHGQRISLATNGSRFDQRNIDGLLRTRLDEMVDPLRYTDEPSSTHDSGNRRAFPLLNA